MNTFAPAIARTTTNPVALWHLLSLDAPTVAVVWTLFVARATHAPLAPAIPFAMFLAVWAIYAADRLLDTSRVPHDHPEPKAKGYRGNKNLTIASALQPRHLFHQQHRTRFVLTLLAASLVLSFLLFQIPSPILLRYSALAALLLSWFLTLHWLAREKPFPKEFLPGPFFASAIFIPSWNPILTPAAICFALLCTLNCLSIHAWEQPLASTHPFTRLSLRSLPALSILAIALPLALLPISANLSPVFLAISLAAALLMLLNHTRTRFDPTTLRAAADLVLLTPLLFAPFAR